MAIVKAQAASEPQQPESASEEKIERRSRRNIDATISSWIFDLREKTRIEQISAIRKAFGSETLLNPV